MNGQSLHNSRTAAMSPRTKASEHVEGGSIEEHVGQALSLREGWALSGISCVSGMMGRKEAPYDTTDRAGEPGRVAGWR